MAPATSRRETKGRMANYMEELAGDMLEGLIAECKGARFSDSAKADIKALALNRLWPMYTTTSEGRNFLKRVVVEDKIEEDIVRELRLAIDIVRNNPHNQ